MLKQMGRTSQAVLIILCGLMTGKLGGLFALFVFNFVKCKLTYNLLFDLYFSLFQLLLHSSEYNCQLSSSVKMSGSFFFDIYFELFCALQ